MLKRYHQIIGGAFRVVDAAIIALTWLAAYGLRFYVPFIEVTKGLPSFERYAALTPVLVALWIFVFSYSGVYSSDRILRRTDEFWLLLKSHCIAIVLFLALTYLFSEYRYSRLVVGYFGLLSGILIPVCRLFLRNSLRAYRGLGFHSTRTIIVGNNQSLEKLLRKFQKFPELGVRIVGACALHPDSYPSSQLLVPQISSLSELKSTIENLQVHQIIIALPRDEYGQLEKVLAQLTHTTVDIQLVPDFSDYATLGCTIEDFEGTPVIQINSSPLQGWSPLFKRAMDIVISFLALLILSPIMLFVSLLVRLDSKGPIFYGQKRMGLDGRVFEMLKFRSMRVGAEDATGAVWANAQDDRKTRIGSLLRKTSLDELPQFWNVFLGQMSLVGPRPERPVFVEKFNEKIPNYMLRHKVKSGITGWAQVNGWRGNTSIENRIECDLYYIRNWSLALDFKILIMTVWKGFINKNAY